MRFDVAYVSILSRLLLFIRHVDQKIEPAAVIIAFNNGDQLLFMKLQQLAHRDGKLF